VGSIFLSLNGPNGCGIVIVANIGGIRVDLGIDVIGVRIIFITKVVGSVQYSAITTTGTTK
jgi:hypothetical protein